MTFTSDRYRETLDRAQAERDAVTADPDYVKRHPTRDPDAAELAEFIAAIRAAKARLAVVAVLILTLLSLAPAAHATTQRTVAKIGTGPCWNRWFDDVQPRYGQVVVHRRVNALITCAAGAYGISQYLSHCVSKAESGWWPWASNGTNFGLYQWSASSFAGERRLFPILARQTDRHIFNARSNALLAMRTVASPQGWHPWTGDRCL